MPPPGTGITTATATEARPYSLAHSSLPTDLPNPTTFYARLPPAGAPPWISNPQAAATILTAELADPYGYGRIVREGEDVLRIVEEKDATAKEKALREINTGIYAFEAPFVFEALSTVGRDNAQGEYYLTDVVAAARSAGRKVCALPVADPEEARASPQATRSDRKRIKELERELLRKERALAETAALLVLSKKVAAIFNKGEAE